jgi:hypothetical protein
VLHVHSLSSAPRVFLREDSLFPPIFDSPSSQVTITEMPAPSDSERNPGTYETAVSGGGLLLALDAILAAAGGAGPKDVARAGAGAEGERLEVSGPKVKEGAIQFPAKVHMLPFRDLVAVSFRPHTVELTYG